MPETVTRELLVQRARDIAPGIGKRAAAAESLRRVPEETIQEIRNAGLLAAFTPKRFGGYALEIGTVIETAREIGEVCGSSAWCLAIYNLHNHLLANFTDAAQDEVFSASPNPVVCGVFMPGGAGTPVDGGYRLTGEWNFASGCDHSSHAILSGLIRAAPDAPPTGLMSFLVRREDLSLIHI